MTIHNCQYCFLHYDSCTCCQYCSFPKGTCDCDSEGEFPCTKLHPANIYKTFHSNRPLCNVMNIHTLEDADKFVMKMYTKDTWPERLKKEQE